MTGGMPRIGIQRVHPEVCAVTAHTVAGNAKKLKG